MRDQFDLSLTAAFHDVLVPDGLAERLLERLAADDAELSAAARRTDEKAERSGVFSRRRLLLGGGLPAAAAGLLLAIWLWPRGEVPLSEQYVLDEAIRRFDAGTETLGYALSEKPAPAAYPLSQMVVRLRGARWRFFSRFLGHRGVVYDLPAPAGRRAALYVVDRKVDGLGLAPALNPFTTSGYCASAWQEDGLLYILVVQGDRATYGGYLNLPRSPVARDIKPLCVGKSLEPA